MWTGLYVYFDYSMLIVDLSQIIYRYFLKICAHIMVVPLIALLSGLLVMLLPVPRSYIF
jgi:hypothetical protein